MFTKRCFLPVLAAAGLLGGCAVVPYEPYGVYGAAPVVTAPAAPVVYAAPAPVYVGPPVYAAPPPVLFNFSYRSGGRGPWRPGYYGGSRWGAHGRYGW